MGFLTMYKFTCDVKKKKHHLYTLVVMCHPILSSSTLALYASGKQFLLFPVTLAYFPPDLYILSCVEKHITLFTIA